MSKLNLPPIQADGTPAPAAQTGYEFGAADNEVIGGLAGWMKAVAVMSLVFGTLISLGGVLNLGGKGSLSAILQVGEGIVLIIIGSWLYPAAGSFRDIVDSQGADIIHLMSALRKLRSVYMLQAILWIAACVLVGLALLFLMGGSSSSSSSM